MPNNTANESKELMAENNNPPRNKRTRPALIRWILILSAVAIIESAVIWAQLVKWQYAIVFPAVVFLLIIALWQLPKQQLRPWADKLDPAIKIEPKDFISAENDARTTLAQIIGGILVLAGLFFTAENLRNSQEILRVTQEGQITERFTKAIEQLGSDKADIPIGGVYALGRIARDSERDHWPIMEILTSYVRRVAPRSWNTEPSAKSNSLFQVPDTDILVELPPNNIRAVIDVLKQRNWQYEKGKNEYFRLDGTKLEAVDFHKAYLRKSSFIATSFKAADLGEADLTEARLSSSDLSAANCDRTILQRVDFTGAIVFHASLNEAHLEEADFTNADLREADFTGACLTRADLRGTNLNKTNFARAILTDTHLEGVDLRNVFGLVQGQIDSARTDDRTQVPPNLHLPKK